MTSPLIKLTHNMFERNEGELLSPQVLVSSIALRRLDTRQHDAPVHTSLNVDHCSIGTHDHVAGRG